MIHPTAIIHPAATLGPVPAQDAWAAQPPLPIWHVNGVQVTPSPTYPALQTQPRPVPIPLQLAFMSQPPLFV